MGDEWLPELLPFDWNAYEESLDRAYHVFVRDFGGSRPAFRGRRLGLKHYPELGGKSATFWHFVTEGAKEADRTPDRARIERIAWPRALIEESNRTPCRVLVWGSRRGSAERWIIALPDFSYVVVLDDRGEFLLPWTAFTVEQDHRRAKLRREWEEWTKAQKS